MNPTTIITADIHIPHQTSYQPRCRLDNYWRAFVRKLSFIRSIQKKYGNIPILDGGDLCNRSRLDPEIEKYGIENLPYYIFTVAGNHEIPNHNLNNLYKSSLSVLEAGRKDLIILNKPLNHMNIEINGFSYGKKIEYEKGRWNDVFRVAIIHTMVYKDPPKSNKIQYSDGLTLLKKMSDFDLIIVGHNHEHFIIKYKKRLLISPGSLMRSSANQIDYQPKIHLWYAEDNKIESIDVPIRQGVVTQDHIRRKEEKEDRMKGFVESLDWESDSEISYEANLERFYLENPNIKDSIKFLTYEVMK